MRKIFKAVSLALAIAIFQVYVLAAPATSTSNILAGRLLTRGTNTVLVNGNMASSGTTILSGSQVQTPEGVDATIQLGSAGRLDVSPGTNLTVTFDKNNVNVNVTSGHAFLSTAAGVKGTVTNPEGKVLSSNSPAAPQTGNNWSGKATAGVVVTIIVITIIIIVVTNDDESPS
ncbi:MAG TPA: hypothetical protein VJS44_03490 [Pyrinomonadaceae bacterium]|nr:hypothetical protein [Pyrinomonadaceae bacterium]